MKVASELGITLTFLLPYSPDLNPIEFSWKDLKRELAMKLNFDSVVEASEPTALKLFRERKLTYSAKWIKSFLTGKELIE